MTLIAVAYTFTCLGFCLGIAASTVLTMYHRAGRENRRASDGPVNPPPRKP